MIVGGILTKKTSNFKFENTEILPDGNGNGNSINQILTFVSTEDKL